MQNNENLKRIHELELKIAVEVRRLCDKHNIKYYLIAGTLLGAVRHKGFIPWDDDMDIGMKRADYEKFIKICESELGESFFLQTWDTDSEYPFSFSKIRLKDTILVEEFSQYCKMKTGMFIDIFPFDNVPLEVKNQNKQRKKYFLYKRILWIKKGMGKNMGKVKYFILKLISLFYSYNLLKKKYYNVQIKYNAFNSTKLVTDGSYNYNKESIDATLFDEQTYVIFEGEKFTTFKRYEDYLTSFYGDYMKLPPEEKRVAHLPIKIDFGKY